MGNKRHPPGFRGNGAKEGNLATSSEMSVGDATQLFHLSEKMSILTSGWQARTVFCFFKKRKHLQQGCRTTTFKMWKTLKPDSWWCSYVLEVIGGGGGGSLVGKEKGG